MAIIQNPATPRASGDMEWGVWLFGTYAPQRRAASRQAMIELTKSWQDEFDKAIRVKKRPTGT